MATAAAAAASEINIQCNECRNWSDAVQNKYLKKFIWNSEQFSSFALSWINT